MTGTNAKEVVQARGDSLIDEALPPVPELNPDDNDIKDDDGTTNISVSGDTKPRWLASQNQLCWSWCHLCYKDESMHA